jgi:hypothetical protein
VVEQKVGDFLLIPPLAPHQVWNRGTCTMKVAWNRTAVETLELALHEALPNSRIVCRDEQYKNKALIYYALIKYSGLLKQANILATRSAKEAEAIGGSRKTRQVKKDFKRLFQLYKEMLLSESFAPDTREHCDYVPFDSNVTCSYCRGNIFNRFLTCKTCADFLGNGADEPYDVCLDCYVMGRSCACQSKFQWVEQFKWKDLLGGYEEWCRQIVEIDGGPNGRTPLVLSEERRIYSKYTTAQICREQLRLRPWLDIKKLDAPTPDEEDEEEIRLNEDGTVKKIVKKKSKTFLENNKPCHVCIKRHPKWMMAVCTMYERHWCYGSLFGAFDLMPSTIMEDPNWECPHCQRICSAGVCRNDSRQKPYEPKGTLLGHDTKKVADVRSVECLVDFSISNLYWIRDQSNMNDENSRLQRKRVEAEIAKALHPTLDDQYVDDDEVVAGGHEEREPCISYVPTGDTVDPALGSGSVQEPTHRDNAESHHLSPGIDHSMGDIYGDNGVDSSLYLDMDHYHNGYVVPSAVMYNDPDMSQEPPVTSSFTPVNAKRRHSFVDDGEQIKLVASKKNNKRRKTVDDEREQRPTAKNKASKQPWRWPTSDCHG